MTVGLLARRYANNDAARLGEKPSASVSQVSLSAYWNLDDAANGNRLDSSLNAHTLSDLNGNVGSAAGKLGNAASFDATHGKLLNIAGNADADFSIGAGDFTIAGWLKSGDVTNPGGVVARSVPTGGGQHHDYYMVIGLTSGRLDWQVYNSGGSASSNAFASGLVNGTWYFFCAEFVAATGKAQLAVNNGAANVASAIASVEDQGGDLEIGNAGFGPGGLISIGWPFNGLIDAVGVWKRLLTSDEKTALYNGGNGLEYPW